MRKAHIALVCSLLAAAPRASLAKPVGGALRWLAAGPGDEIDASIDAGYVVFTSRDATGTDVVLADLVAGTLSVVAGASGDAEEPDLSRNVLAYRTPEGIALQFLLNGSLLRLPAEPGAGAPVVTPVLAAWEVGPPGDRDVGWYQLVSGVEGVLASPGDQRAPAGSGAAVAWIDDANGGAVMLHDLARSETRLVCGGRADSIAIDGLGPLVRVAVARSEAGGDLDVEVWDGEGTRLAVLDEPGTQRNPRISGAWVAFEDLSTGRSQIVLWNHVTGLAYLPRISAGGQTLGDLSTGPTLLGLAFSERVGTSDDLALYTVPLPVVDDGTGSDWPPEQPPVPPATCDDPAPTVLASLLLARERKESQAGEVSFTTGDGKDLPVLLCIDEVQVDEAWVSLDGVLLASPADFAARNAHLERRAAIRGGEGLLSAVLLADCGSQLHIRVLADPGQLPAPPVAATPPGGGPGGSVASGMAAAGYGDGAGCGTGPAGPMALLGLVVHFWARRRPRRC